MVYKKRNPRWIALLFLRDEHERMSSLEKQIFFRYLVDKIG